MLIKPRAFRAAKLLSLLEEALDYTQSKNYIQDLASVKAQQKKA